MPDSPGSSEPGEVDLRIFSYKDFLDLLKSSYQEQSKAGEEWQEKEVVECTQNNDGTILTKRQIYDLFPMIIEEAVTARAAIILINGVLNRMHTGTLFYGDNKPGEILTMQEQIAYSWLSRYKLNEINEQILSFATRTAVVDVEYSQKKSASSERMLTLTTEIYTEQSGEWKNRFKQEFIHTGGEVINVENASIDQPLKVYPNPSSGIVNIQLDQVGKKVRLEVMNLQGQLVYSEHINQTGGDDAYAVNISFLPEGSYIVRASTNTDLRYTKINLVK